MVDSNITLEIDEIDLYQFVDTVFTIKVNLIDKFTNQKVTGEVSNIKILLAFEGNASIEHRCREHHPNLLEVIHNSGIKENGEATVDLKIKDVSMNHDRQRFVIYFECYRPHGEFNIISAVSNPIICIRYKLIMSESYTQPYIWYKDEGAKDKCIKILAKLIDSSNNTVQDKSVPLIATLIYSSGQQVQPINVLTLFNDKDRPLSIVGGTEVVRFRVNEVSRNHRKQLFHLFITPDTATHPELFEISPVKSIAFEVKSKRTSEARNSDQQFPHVPKPGSIQREVSGPVNWPSTNEIGEDEHSPTTSMRMTSVPPSIPTTLLRTPSVTINTNNNPTIHPDLLEAANQVMMNTAAPAFKRTRYDPSMSMEAAPVTSTVHSASVPNGKSTGNNQTAVVDPPTNAALSAGQTAQPISISPPLTSMPIVPPINTNSHQPNASSNLTNTNTATSNTNNNSNRLANMEEALFDAPVSALRQIADWTQATCHLLAASVLPTIANIQNNSTGMTSNPPNAAVPCNIDHIHALLEIYSSRIQGSLAYLQSYFAIHEQFSVPYHQHAMYIAYQQQQYLQQLETVLSHFTNTPASSSSSSTSSSTGAGTSSAGNTATNANGTKNYKRQFFIPSSGMPPVLQPMNPPMKSPRVFPGYAPSLNRMTSGPVPSATPTNSSSSAVSDAAASLSRVIPRNNPMNTFPTIPEESVTIIIAKTIQTTLENHQVVDLGLPAYSGTQPQITLIGFYQQQHTSSRYTPLSEMDYFLYISEELVQAITDELITLVDIAEDDDDATYYIHSYMQSEENKHISKSKALDEMKREIHQRMIMNKGVPEYTYRLVSSMQPKKGK